MASPRTEARRYVGRTTLTVGFDGNVADPDDSDDDRVSDISYTPHGYASGRRSGSAATPSGWSAEDSSTWTNES